MTSLPVPRIMVDAWLVVLVIDRISYTDDATHPVAVVSLACALWALLTRSNRFAAVALLGDAVAIAIHAPDVANHLTLLFFIDLLIVGALLRPTLVDYGVVATVLRTMVIGVYVAAAIHKLNSSFLDPAVSCAVSVAERTAFDVALPDGIGWLLVAGALLIELSLPILLAIPGLRRVGLVVGLSFHGALALVPIGGVASFSVFMAASYLAFLPADTFEGTERLWTRVVTPLRSLSWVAAIPIPLTVLITAVNVLLPGLNLLGVRFAASLILFSLLFAIVRCPSDPERDRARPALGAAVAASAMLLFIAVSALAPYTGARTQLAFSMFSNLRTERSPNHLFLPRLDLFEMQDDLVSIVDPPSSEFDPITGPGLVVPSYEVGRRLSLTDSVESITVLDNGAERTYEGAALRNRFPEPDRISGWLFRMRATEARGPVSCRH